MLDIDKETGLYQVYMHNGVVVDVWICGGLISDFSITSGSHQGSMLSSFLYAIVIDDLYKTIRVRYLSVCYLLIILS